MLRGSVATTVTARWSATAPRGRTVVAGAFGVADVVGAVVPGAVGVDVSLCYVMLCNVFVVLCVVGGCIAS